MQAVSSSRVPTVAPTMTLPQGFSLQLMREISDARDSTAFFQQKMSSLSDVECFLFRQSLYDYTVEILDLTEKLLPILATAPPLQEDIQPIQSEPGATALPAAITQTVTEPTITLTDNLNIRLMKHIVDYSITHSADTNSATTAIKEFFQSSSPEFHCQMVASLRKYSQTLYQDAQKAKTRLAAPRLWCPNQDIQARTVLLVHPETLPTAASSANTSSRISVTTEAIPKSTASAALSTATTQDLIVLTARQTTEHLSTSSVIPSTTHHLPTPQQCAAPPEPQPFLDEPGPSTIMPIERPLSVQSSSTSSSKSHQKYMCDDRIERSLISLKRGLAVKDSPVHDGAKGVFLHNRTCDENELIADYEGTFVFRYPLKQRSNTFLMCTTVSPKREKIFLPDERYVSWSEVYFKTGDTFIEIGIIGKKEISFINHDDKNPNAKLLTNYDNKVTRRVRNKNQFVLCVSRKRLAKFLKTLHVQVIATQAINDNQEILCNYKTKQKAVDFNNYIVMPSEEEKEEFDKALQASAQEAPDSDLEPNTGSESDDSFSESDRPATYPKISPQKSRSPQKRSKRKPPKPINIAKTSEVYRDFDTDILTPLRNRFQGQAYGHLNDITKEIEKETDSSKKKTHEDVLALIARHITLSKKGDDKEMQKLTQEATEIGIDEGEVNTLLQSAAKIIINCFDINDKEWQHYIDQREALEHAEHTRKRIKTSSSKDIQH